MRHAAPVFLVLTLGLFGTSAVAQDLYVYPGKGQTPEQQEQDEFACYKWAKQESGVDAGAPPKDGDPGRGAFGALGAAVGAVAKGGSGAKKGAAIGGTVGGVGGAGGAASQKKKEQQQERARFERAFTARMEARGYVVR